MRNCAAVTFVVLLAAVPCALATTHTVDAGGGGDFETIYAAITAATSGDTILVAGGTYAGTGNRHLSPGGKNLVFLADDSARVPVIIDCEGADYAFRFEDGEDATTLVRGFTVLNGYKSSNGGAMQLVNSSSPVFEDCSFIDCRGSNGGVLHSNDSNAVFTNCVFRGNSAANRAGAIYVDGGVPTFTGCLFDGNLVDSDSYGGGAMFLNACEAEITNCTFVENDLDQIVLYSSNSDVSISNCIIANSLAGRGVAINASGVGMVQHCIVFGNAEDDSLECGHAGNLFVDPLFCDDTVDDYTHCEDSSALSGNNDWSEEVGAYASAAGCGPCGSPVEDSSWGRVKALYQ